MIDAENQIFTLLATELRAAFPGLYVTGEYEREPKQVPCVSIEEKDNAVWRNCRTNTNVEQKAAVMYEVNVYSNKLNGKKQEAKQIMAVADEVFARKNFSRTMTAPIPNLADATVYRLTSRYQAIVGPDGQGGFVVNIR